MQSNKNFQPVLVVMEAQKNMKYCPNMEVYTAQNISRSIRSSIISHCVQFLAIHRQIRMPDRTQYIYYNMVHAIYLRHLIILSFDTSGPYFQYLIPFLQQQCMIELYSEVCCRVSPFCKIFWIDHVAYDNKFVFYVALPIVIHVQPRIVDGGFSYF